MRAGVVYPQTELGGDPGALVAFAQAAEDLNYDHLILYDHVVGAEHSGRKPALWGPYTDQDPFHEVFTAFAYLAGLTRRIEFVTGVLVLPQRQTALVAKQAADIDIFSGGRLRLGVGIGWNWVEFDALEMGAQYKRRGRREDQQIGLLREFWTKPLVEHTDATHHIDRAGITPLPGRSIPIWLGGFSQAAFERAVRVGDGFLFSAERQSEAVGTKPKLDAMLRRAGRATDGFGFESMQRFVRGPGCWHDDIVRWRDVGGTHISLMTMGANLTTIDQHIGAIRDWREVYDATT
jgi:probable F420-dependent oxidoreductase